MLDKAGFALIVLTAESERTDAVVLARQNVVHEAGLFQGRLGWRKAIVLREDGCEEFSNITGLGQIPIPNAALTVPTDRAGFNLSGRRDSNPRPSPWQGDALPTEPLPRANETDYTAGIGGAWARDRTEDLLFFRYRRLNGVLPCSGYPPVQ